MGDPASKRPTHPLPKFLEALALDLVDLVVLGRRTVFCFFVYSYSYAAYLSRLWRRTLYPSAHGVVGWYVNSGETRCRELGGRGGGGISFISRL